MSGCQALALRSILNCGVCGYVTGVAAVHGRGACGSGGTVWRDVGAGFSSEMHAGVGVLSCVALWPTISGGAKLVFFCI